MSMFQGLTRGQTRKLSHVADEMYAAHIADKGIVLRHIADLPANLGSIAIGIETKHAGRPFRRWVKAKQSVDECRLSGAIRTEQPNRTSAQLSGEPIEYEA